MAFESGQAVVANDYPSHPNADPVALATGAKSVIALPIKNAEETIAVAGITSPEINHFNPDRVRLLTAIVDGLGPLLETPGWIANCSNGLRNWKPCSKSPISLANPELTKIS